MMKFNRTLLIAGTLCITGLFLFTGCSIGGLDLQKNYDYHEVVLDSHLPMNTFEFMQSRNKPDNDSLFNIMLKAIHYAGLEALYTDKGPYTYFLLTDTAFTDPQRGYYHDKGVQDITALPVDTVKALLQYHIVKGKYTSLDLKEDIPMEVETLLAGENGKMTLERDDQYRIRINRFSGSKRTTTTVTTNLEPTNGVIHVIDQYAAYRP